VDGLDRLQLAGLIAHQAIELFLAAQPHAAEGEEALLELAAGGAAGGGEARLGGGRAGVGEGDFEEVVRFVRRLVPLAVQDAERAVGDFLDIEVGAAVFRIDLRA
jgi:hypothetical protein